MSNMFKDRRSDKRHDREAEVEYKILDDSADIMEMGYKKAVIKNISMGGVCMRPGARLKTGNVVRIDIPLAGKDKKINAFCEVEWCGSGQEGFLAGLSFITLGEEEAVILGELIKTYN